MTRVHVREGKIYVQEEEDGPFTRVTHLSCLTEPIEQDEIESNDSNRVETRNQAKEQSHASRATDARVGKKPASLSQLGKKSKVGENRKGLRA